MRRTCPGQAKVGLEGVTNTDGLIRMIVTIEGERNGQTLLCCTEQGKKGGGSMLGM